jgi:hypothetical protein
MHVLSFCLMFGSRVACQDSQILQVDRACARRGREDAGRAAAPEQLGCPACARASRNPGVETHCAMFATMQGFCVYVRVAGTSCIIVLSAKRESIDQHAIALHQHAVLVLCFSRCNAHLGKRLVLHARRRSRGVRGGCSRLRRRGGDRLLKRRSRWCTPLCGSRRRPRTASRLPSR